MVLVITVNAEGLKASMETDLASCGEVVPLTVPL
jgi:hypothetical protein